MSRVNVKDMPPWCTTGDVGAALDWHQDTIRAHLIPLSKWKDMSAKEREGKVPSIKIGGRYKIPRWWLEDLLGVNPPGSR